LNFQRKIYFICHPAEAGNNIPKGGNKDEIWKGDQGKAKYEVEINTIDPPDRRLHGEISSI